MRIISEELLQKDLDAMERRIADVDRPRGFQNHMHEKMRREELAVLLKARAWLQRKRPLRLCLWTRAEAQLLGRCV